MRRNNVAAAPPSNFYGSRFKAFDRLPFEIRAALNEAVVSWDAVWIRWRFNKRLKGGESLKAAIAKEVAAIRADDDREVEEFQYQWPSRFGRYPHVAARASIMRYERGAPSG